MRVLLISCVLVFVLGCSGTPQNADTTEIRVKAEAGDPAAMLVLGSLYDMGAGVPRDRTEAAAWYLRAAQAGNAEAQNSLGSMYQAGEGVEQDFSQALHWYQKSS